MQNRTSDFASAYRVRIPGAANSQVPGRSICLSAFDISVTNNPRTKPYSETEMSMLNSMEGPNSHA